jgi:hypothetical protein
MLYSVNGALLANGNQTANDEMQWTLPDLQQGIYLLEIMHAGRRSVIKFPVLFSNSQR